MDKNKRELIKMYIYESGSKLLIYEMGNNIFTMKVDNLSVEEMHEIIEKMKKIGK